MSSSHDNSKTTTKIENLSHWNCGMIYEVRGYVIRLCEHGFISTDYPVRRPSDLVIYALREGPERVRVAGTKISTTRRASADTVLSERYLLRASVGISCSQSPFP